MFQNPTRMRRRVLMAQTLPSSKLGHFEYEHKQQTYNIDTLNIELPSKLTPLLRTLIVNCSVHIQYAGELSVHKIVVVIREWPCLETLFLGAGYW